MNRDSSHSRVFGCALLGAALAVALGGSTAILAQPSPDAAASDAASAPADEPRRSRERRRAAEPKQPAATSAATAVAVDAQTRVEPAVEAADTEIICKNYKPTGSRMARRICATATQWAAAGEATSEEASETFRRVREQSAIAIVPSGNAAAPSN